LPNAPTIQAPNAAPNPFVDSEQLVLGKGNNSLAEQVEDSKKGEPYATDAPRNTLLRWVQNLWEHHRSHTHAGGIGGAFFLKNGGFQYERGPSEPAREAKFQDAVRKSGPEAAVALYLARAVGVAVPASVKNAHPFVYETTGEQGQPVRWAMTMNGDTDIDEQMLESANAQMGTRLSMDEATDTERLFIILLGGLKQQFGTVDLDKILGEKNANLEAVKNNLARTFKTVLEKSAAREERLDGPAFNRGTLLRSPNVTIALSDGKYTFVINHDAKQWISIHREPSGRQADAVILASEPIYNGALWQELPNDSLLTVVSKPSASKLDITLQSVDLPSGFDLWKKRATDLRTPSSTQIVAPLPQEKTSPEKAKA
jgi:predicted glutamine amidotransferase